MVFTVLSGGYTLYRYPSGRNPAAAGLWDCEFACWSVSPGESTLVCPSAFAAPEPWERSEPGWRVLKIHGPFDFGVVGILAQASGVLARAGIPIFALSTFDTDYLLVKQGLLDAACAALEEGGHEVRR